MNRKFLIAGAIATAAVGTMAVAGALAPHGMMRADSNGDGIVSRSEFFAQADSRFKKIDANGDGKIGATELHGPRMADMDADGDGTITKAEFAAAENARFKLVDANGDQRITEAEIKADHDRHRAEREARFEGAHGGPGWHHRGGMGAGPGGPGGPGGPVGMLARLDTDHDGKLSRAEFDAPFDRMDTNKDGFVDETERQAMMQALRAEFGRNGDRWNGKAPPAPPAHTLPPASSPTSSSPSTNTGK